MRKPAAYLAMAGIVLLLIGADVVILTRTESVSRLAEAELRKRVGGAVTWRSLRASLDGVITLEGLAHATLPLRAERVEIRLRGLLSGTVEEVRIEGIRVELTQKLIEELTRETGEKKSIRDFFPEARDLPRVILRGGTVDLFLAGVLAGGKPQTVSIAEVTLVPFLGWRCHLEGRVQSALVGTWKARGEADLDEGGWRLDLETEGLRLDPSTAELLKEEVRTVWEKYRPQGLCDARITLQGRPKEPLDFRATVLARDMGITYRPFPYAVSNMTGELEFTSRDFRIKHMTARHGPAVVRFDGAAGGYSAEAEYRFRIEIEDAPLDEELRAALQPESRKIWDLFEPSGKVSVKGWAFRDPGPDKPGHIPLDLSFREASAKYKEFPYPLKNLSGDVRVVGDDVLVKALRSVVEDTTVEIQGKILDMTGDATIDLEIEARRLRLEDRLKEALKEDNRKIWEKFSPTGAVDLTWRVKKEKGKPEVQSGRVRALGNAVLYSEVPLPVSELEGVIDLQPGRVTLERLQGKVRGARLMMQGTITDEATTLDELDVVGLTLNDAVKDKLPKEVGDLLKRMRISGRVNFHGSLSMRKGGEKRVTMSLDLSKGVIDTEPRFEDLEGSAWLTGTFGTKTTLMGPLSFTQATVWGKRLTEVSTSLIVVDNKVTFSGIKASAYGGLVAGNYTIDTATGEYGGGFTVDRLDLKEYALDTQGYSKKMLEGKVSVDLKDLTGLAGDAASARGKGQLKIQDGLLWDIPIFVGLFNLNPENLIKGKNRFDTGGLDFEIRNEKFDLKHLIFTSESMSVVGKGRVNFNGELSLVMKPQSGRLLGIDFFATNWIASALSWFTGGFMGVEVSGTFDKPETTLKPFTGFK